jgi:hypothetical protein
VPRSQRRTRQEDRATQLLRRALQRYERLADPLSVAPVEGEPEWVERLPRYGRAFARLLLLEATRTRGSSRKR